MTRFPSRSNAQIAFADEEGFEPFGAAPTTTSFEPLGTDLPVSAEKPAAGPDAPTPGLDLGLTDTLDAESGTFQDSGLDGLDPSVESGDLADPFSENGLNGLPDLPSIGADGTDDPFGAPEDSELGALPDLPTLDDGADPFSSAGLQEPGLNELPDLSAFGAGSGEASEDPFGEPGSAELPELPSFGEESDPFAAAGETPTADPFGAAENGELPPLPAGGDFGEEELETAPSPDDALMPLPIIDEAESGEASPEAEWNEEDVPSLGAAASLDTLQDAAETATSAIGSELETDAELGFDPVGEAASASSLAGPDAITALADQLVGQLEQSVNEMRQTLLDEVSDSVATILGPLVSRLAMERAVEAFGEDIAASLIDNRSNAIFQAEVPQDLLSPVRAMIEERGLPVEAKAGRHNALLLHLDTTTRAISLPRLQDFCDTL
ncbi:hypothetical protein [Notoacmeibacter ruber]|uniref:Uncharacterized protein n=1 Tax=Notoacmeibacter ruber TaxID=2670375 RepID=A0A3L7JEF1_9HYPH|nr:hypothetical protein [Notoacmeibacter ruber]RLQ88834.1 hypothetical protein D8780_12005 [Notoacmeibacter ruber]